MIHDLDNEMEEARGTWYIDSELKGIQRGEVVVEFVARPKGIYINWSTLKE